MLPSCGFPGGSVVKNPPTSVEDSDLISSPGRSPGERNDNPLQSSCLENRLDSGAWGATVKGLQKSLM